ncbi:TetR/AcrR family transcriptional regulator [Nitratireductor indicus]|uniref:TetR/AcrR family transcriptional regulator n=1 Tax=Nitratireductor indicus TaxID=721133 RepID=UPI002875F773|nr:TetR/AcrR family transcriptional regulator [Nitratireductor indicus]MDS1135283.1 TetR/AcrR family transcriptional regulator [Nitratireductor indicus]
MQEKLERRSNRDRTAATRAALLKAARALFIEKGYADTGTPEIVAAAKVTRGALYHHFSDKAGLLRAIVEAEAKEVASTIEHATRDAETPLDALTEGADAYFEAMRTPGRARLLLLEGPVVLGTDEMAAIDSASGGQTLLDGLRLADRDGRLAGVPLKQLSEMLSAAFDRAALAIAGGAREAPYRDAARSLLKALLLGKT